MSAGYEPFDAVHTTLTKGINLIEAGAGTGKTYAIVMMVVRALVELNLELKQILIVTYTKAATEELKGRIRERLELVRTLLKNQQDAEGQCEDKTLQEWLAAVDRLRAQRAIHLALAEIDTAQVFTIHGYCQRMLAELALESGQRFEVELLADLREMVQELADDFWRERIYPLPPLACRLVVDGYPAPERLLASVVRILGTPKAIEPAVCSVEDALLQLDSSVAALQQWWDQDGEQLVKEIENTETKGYFKKDGFKILSDLIDFCRKNTKYLPPALACLQREGLLELLHGNRLRGAKKSGWIEHWPLPEEEVAGVLRARDEFLLALRTEFALRLQAGLGQRLDTLGVMGFDDLITRLAGAVHGDTSGALRDKLAEKYRAAFIDEFQDTDAAQYTIFSAVFGRGTHWLYLIGDPKQAIYSFRGADIYSYFRAKNAASRKLTLGVNFRSNEALVEEVNRLFSTRTQPFLYEENLLSYLPVLSAKAAGEQQLAGDSQLDGSMVYCQLSPRAEDKEGCWSSSAAGEKAIRFTVQETVRLLSGGVTVQEKDGARPLQPKDIAILVRSHTQGESVRETLGDARVPAVLISKNSVFHSDECRELFLLLQAIEGNADMVRLKTAMSISWFGYSGDELVSLWQDENLLAGWSERFGGYQKLWQDRGFMSMMSALLEAEQVLVTVAGLPLAERRLTNIFQLIELVHQEEAEEKLGIFQVLQWLRRRMADDKVAANSELLMESDEEAVQIVTMHSAKGLEYHVVFCPFLWYAADRLQSESNQIVFHDASYEQKLDLGSPRFEERRQQAVVEQRAEDLRLLYVAVTRAKSRCYVVWADVKKYASVLDSFSSALGYLLFPAGQVTFAEQQTILQRRAEKGDGVALRMIDALPQELPLLQVSPAAAVLQAALPSTRSLHTSWQMSSFSALAGLSEYEFEAAGRGGPAPGVSSGAPAAEMLIDTPDLPAGAHFGSAVHDLLERIPFSELGQQSEEQLALVRQICRKYGVAAEESAMRQLLEMIVRTPLLAADLAADSGSSRSPLQLAHLSEHQVLKELEYYLHLDPVVTTEISNILRDEPTVAPLGPRELRGYLTGFIDLIFEFNNKYYLVDYKTNFLGKRVADYATEKLVAAMQAHNYGLQYWLYTVVLDHYLANMVDGYVYERDFGGVLYLFVRGMSPARPGSGVFYTMPEHRKVQALADLLKENEDVNR